MNTKILMTTSALFLGILGIALSFLPDEIADYLLVEPNLINILFLKLLSAMYLGFAILNWMARETLIGGIYNRPIAIGNFMHFVVGAITLLKVIGDIEVHKIFFIIMLSVYLIFAILFAYVFRTNPSTVKK